MSLPPRERGLKPGGATGRIAEIMGLSKFQSTLPRGERHMFTLSFAHDYSVSIHAPAGGATTLTK